LWAGLLLVSCSGRVHEKKPADEDRPIKTEPAYQKPPASSQDTLVIPLISAVFYNPDSLQLNAIKARSPKNVFDSEVHNCFYQMRNARMVIRKYYPAVHIIETSTARFLLFVKKDGRRVCIDLDTKGDMCGVFLFDQARDPELIDMMNVDTALGFYFEK
jgi:hypothetical protein